MRLFYDFTELIYLSMPLLFCHRSVEFFLLLNASSLLYMFDSTLRHARMVGKKGWNTTYLYITVY